MHEAINWGGSRLKNNYFLIIYIYIIFILPTFLPALVFVPLAPCFQTPHVILRASTSALNLRLPFLWWLRITPQPVLF